MRNLIRRIFSRSSKTEPPAMEEGSTTASSGRASSGSSQQGSRGNQQSTRSDGQHQERSSSSGAARKKRRRRSRNRSDNAPSAQREDSQREQQDSRREQHDSRRDGAGRPQRGGNRGGRGGGRSGGNSGGHYHSKPRVDAGSPMRRGVPKAVDCPAPKLPADGAPRIITEREHNISSNRVSHHAREIVEQLRDAGYSAELVGGCVRDLLLGLSPKDFDIATDAQPEEVQDIFRRARLVGRRFRLAHVRAGRDIFEVATYRAAPGDGDDDPDHALTDGGRLISDNVYGTRQQDALRRDFTVNALYYDPLSGDVIDYVGGVEDLESRVMRVIGDPDTRLREDPVRMLRAIRFAARLGLDIERHCAETIPRTAHLLEDVPPARLFDETLKLFHYGHARDTWDALREYGIAKAFFPETTRMIDEGDTVVEALLEHAFDNTDKRVRVDKPVIPPFLFAAALWGPMRARLADYKEDGMSPRNAFMSACEDTIGEQAKRIAIPKRVSIPVREIWDFQSRLENGRDKRSAQFSLHKRFRAAYDFLLLRAEAGDADTEIAEWWTEYIDADDDRRDELLDVAREEDTAAGRVNTEATGAKKKRRRRRRKRSRRPGGENSAGSDSDQ